MNPVQASVGRPGTGLPAEPTSFVGRHRELAEIRRHMFLGRLITLNGPGGVGKSRLALRLARKVRRAFPDGVFLVDLADLQDPALLPQAVAGAFGISGSVDDPAGRLLARIRSARMLVVLDHCDHVLEESARFVREVLTAGSGPRVLVTSRQALGLAGERVLRVGPLSVPAAGAVPDSAYGDVFSDAVRLFVDRAASVCPGFALEESNRDVVVRICERVDGMPLAIELAAARLSECTPEELLNRLDDRFGLLTGGSASTRHEALADSIGWSFELCTPDEQLTWRRLSCFVGDFDLTAAEEICAEEPLERERIGGLLEALVSKSVLLREEHGGRSYYRMFESIREFGRSRLTAAGRRKVVQERYREHFHQLARRFCEEHFGPQQLDWIQHLIRVHPNIRRTLEQDFAEPGRARAALRSSVLLWAYWISGNALREGCMWLRRGLELVPEPTPLRADGLTACAFLSLHLYLQQEAEELLAEAKELAERIGDPALQSRVTGVRGAAAVYGGDPERAAGLFEQAAAGHQISADPFGYVNSMVLLSNVRFFLGDPRGEAAATECLQICEARGATWTKCYALWAVALFRWRGGDQREATLLLQQAVRLQRSVRDMSGLSTFLELLSWCSAESEQPMRTVQLAGAAAELRRISGGQMGNARYFEGTNHRYADWTRHVLGAAESDRCYAEGGSWGVDEMIAYALEEGVTG